MFNLLCGEKIKASVTNPYSRSEETFLLFDSVHIFKSIQYKWLNQHDVNQTFLFPESESLLTLMNEEELDKDQVTLPQNLKSAKLSDLKNIYSNEQTNVVKLALNLTQKVLYPTSIERQNVLLC